MIKKSELFPTGEMTRSDRCIHTPSTFAKHNLLYVQEVGYLQSIQPHRCVREKLDSYLFIVVIEGSGFLDISGSTYQLGKGDCAFIDCQEHYEHISDEKDAWKLAWVHFNGHSAKGYYELFKKFNRDKNVFGVDDLELWNTQIRTLLNTQRERNLQAELICGEHLITLLNSIIFSVFNNDVEESEQFRQIASELREYVNRQYADPMVLKQIEEHFGKTCIELGETFANYFGVGLLEYINNRRFIAAKELLRFSIKPIEDVAVESGINDVFLMQHLFEENEGMTAEEYRSRWAAWVR